MAALPIVTNALEDSQRILELQVDHGPAPLPVANWTKSFWINAPGANPLAAEGSEGPLTQDADVCILGSGLTGVSAAYHLGKELEGQEDVEKLKVVILDARDFCAGATGRNGGQLSLAFTSFTAASQRFGTDEALRWLALERHTVSSIVGMIEEHGLERDVDLVNGGRIELLITPKEYEEARADYEAAKAAGAPLDDVTWLSADETYGSSHPGYLHTGYNLWPLKFVTELYKLAAASPALNLTLHTRTPVTAILSSSESAPRPWTLTTPRGQISCTRVVHATNAYVSHLLPHMRGPSGVIPVRGQVMALRAAAPLESISRHAWTGNDGFEYWFPRPFEEGQEHPLVIIGGGRDATGPTFETYVADDSEVNEKAGSALRRFLPALFPGKYEEGREPEWEWSGIMAFTATSDPFVGRVVDPSNPTGYDGNFVSAGYSGHGMPRAFACAEVIAQMVAAEILAKPWSPPEWLPRHYLTREA
ncbi:hypothetical protein FOMPIDRAFT_1026232 [Fomitopsis schrenkii]|uniref:FAD dependent oxidoreductase domain-containing protein n=1 Tax=Fomitopsis schrenkii TaxID=2126942 RepID=S8DNZ0_FOMSC|nr:hypothetical protein FOMPIDRAFT_1026232 [Fomitopsis schrenkii]